MVNLMDSAYTSFSVVHKVSNVDIFVLVTFRNKLDTVVG